MNNFFCDADEHYNATFGTLELPEEMTVMGLGENSGKRQYARQKPLLLYYYLIARFCMYYEILLVWLCINLMIR